MAVLTASARWPKAMAIFILAGAVIALTAALAVRKSRTSSAISSSNLGEVSEQWLAEHRASHPL
jgi:uncharacterized membrane protein YraQ (UPF0718 family)